MASKVEGDDTKLPIKSVWYGWFYIRSLLTPIWYIWPFSRYLTLQLFSIETTLTSNPLSFGEHKYRMGHTVADRFSDWSTHCYIVICPSLLKHGTDSNNHSQTSAHYTSRDISGSTCVVVHQCYNGESQSQWDMPNFNPMSNRNPWITND